MLTTDELKILNTFPKKRTPLPALYNSIYKDEYLRNRGVNTNRRSVKKYLESWMHRKVAQAESGNICSKILEVGAGTLNHFYWEKNHAVYDIVEPMAFLYQNRYELKGVANIFNDINQIKKNSYYDKICSVATLEHVANLPEMIAKTALLLKPNGIAVHSIPSEGELAWELSWRSTTALSFKYRHGLDYKTLMRYEHINTADEVLKIIRMLFHDVTITRFPTNYFPSSIYQCIFSRGPIKSKAKEVEEYYL